MNQRGYFGIVLFEPKIEANLGIILRSAHCFGANFVATIGNRYRRVSSDTSDSTKHLPCFHFDNFESFDKFRPQNAKLIGVEVNGKGDIMKFHHPERAIYVLGGEDRTLPPGIISQCDYTIFVKTPFCLNLSACASILLFDRTAKSQNYFNL